MVAAVRAGASLRAVARETQVSLCSVQFAIPRPRAGGTSARVHRATGRDHPAPPRGWYLLAVAAGAAECDSFDTIEDVVIEGGIPIEVLTGISLLGGLGAAWPEEAVTTDRVLDALAAHWRAGGLPEDAQFDNDTWFQGAHQVPDAMGRVTRRGLSLQGTPVFPPGQAHGFQEVIENGHGRWETKGWERFHHESRAALQACSARAIAAYCRRTRNRQDAVPPRRPFPAVGPGDLRAPLREQRIFLRRTTEAGTVSWLGRTFPVDPRWLHRSVRCEVDLDAGRLRVEALRRRGPATPPLLTEGLDILPAARGPRVTWREWHCHARNLPVTSTG